MRNKNKIAFVGLDKAIRDISAYSERKQAQIKKETNMHAIELQKEAKLAVGSHGTITRKDGKSRTVLIDTGLMRASIHIGFAKEVNDVKPFSVSGSGEAARKARATSNEAKGVSQQMDALGGSKKATGIGVGVNYAKYHEFGIGVPKRSFLQPAADIVRPKFRAAVKKVLKGVR